MGKKKRGKKSCFYLWLEHSLLGSSVQVKGTSGAVGNQIYSISKSRDITLPTNVRLVKAMVFPAVIYGCESWTIKKAEHQRIDAFKL